MSASWLVKKSKLQNTEVIREHACLLNNGEHGADTLEATVGHAAKVPHRKSSDADRCMRRIRPAYLPNICEGKPLEAAPETLLEKKNTQVQHLRAATSKAVPLLSPTAIAGQIPGGRA